MRMKNVPAHALTACAVALSALPPAGAQPCQRFDVLVFSKTAGFRHGAQITAGAGLIQSLGQTHGFGVDHTEDAALITKANLSGYAAVVFLNTSGNILSPAQEAALQGYILGGGGFVGVHAAADTEYAWPFYGTLLGTWFQSHPAVQPASLSVADPGHPSTATLPATFQHTDEWYNFQANVASSPTVRVLLTVDESTYTGGTMGPVHPIAWSQDVAGAGRSWYTALGHTAATYSAPFFRDHLGGGILWAAASSRTATVCGLQTHGAGSGTPPLSLSATAPSPTTGRLVLTGADPGASGLLCASTCGASTTAGPLTLLVELGPPALVAHTPVSFDATGRWETTLPLSLGLAGTLGDTVFFQGAQLTPSVGLSNALRLALCR